MSPNAAQNAFSEANALFSALGLRKMVLRTGPFDGRRTPSAPPGRARYFSGNVELTFLGHPFESLGRIFDPILAVIAIGRKQPDHLIGAGGGRTRDIAGSEIDGLSNGIFMLQRPLPSRKNVGHAHGPAAMAD